MTSFSVPQAASMSETDRPVTIIQRTFERCGPAFCRYFTVRTGGDVALVDDLMQQLWLRARLKAADVREPNAEPWLWRVAQNLLREHRRQHGHSLPAAVAADPGLARELARQFDTQELPDEALARQEVRDQLLLALTELPGAEQELLIGFYFEGRGQAELAGDLEISARAVEGRLYRARLALRDKLAHLDQ